MNVPCFHRLLLIGLVLSGAAMPARNSSAAPKSARDCSTAQQSSYPKASISNGLVNAVIYLPDPKNGYYRGSRFDWSGVVACLDFKGHTYFGVWFPHYDPYLHDAITGPVEEFRSGFETALGYDQARPGELFVKPGVGVLRRIDNAPFNFAVPYPLVDAGKWTVNAGPSRLSFTQDLKGPNGIAYQYTKILKLEKDQPVLILEHELKNTGTAAIETDVYNHDFFVLDDGATGPGMVVRFPFAPRAEEAFTNGARIDGKEIVYDRELQTGETVQSVLTGYSNQPSDYDFIVENRNTGAGVEQTGDLPISHLNFWSIRTTICPEAFVHLNIAPSKSAHWTIRYRFYELSK
jgi:hypothetical protein